MLQRTMFAVRKCLVLMVAQRKVGEVPNGRVHGALTALGVWQTML
jgi:hypothetical protein